MPSPQLGQTPQSLSQLAQVSPLLASQTPLPQLSQAPQSALQLAQVSPSLALQTPSPQAFGHVPQSAGQLLQLSPPITLQTPSPQTLHAPQSAAQVSQLSPNVGAQIPSPHAAQVPQSTAQLLQVSPAAAAQMPSPQLAGQAPQSAAQLLQLSWALGSHSPLPHVALQGLPHCWQSDAHASSQSPVQQAGSIWQTQLSQLQPLQPAVPVALQPPSSAQAPQSAAHSLHDSVGAQTPLPQTSEHPPQSVAQLLQVSPAPALQRPSPQPLALHAPFWQVVPLGQSFAGVKIVVPLGAHSTA